MLKIGFVLILALFVFLFSPLTVELLFDNRSSTNSLFLEISWLRELWGFSIKRRVVHLIILKRRIKLLQLKQKVSKQEAMKEKKQRGFNPYKMVTGLAKPSFKSLKRVLKATKLETVQLDVEFGTGDPWETAKICCWGSALLFLLPLKVNFRLNPNFSRKVFRGFIFLRLKLALYHLLWAGIIFGSKFGLVWMRSRR